MSCAFGDAGDGGASPPLPASAAAAQASESERDAAERKQAAHRRWHSMRRCSRATDDARGAAGRGRRATVRGLSSNGVRQQAGRDFRPRGRRARLRAPAGAGGQARLLALALALPRRRRHVPAERQRRRRLRRRRPARRRDRPAPASPRTSSGDVDGLVVDEHVGLAELAVGGPARDRVQHGVELLLGALLDPDLPALAAERDDVGLGERHEVADQLRSRR